MKKNNEKFEITPNDMWLLTSDRKCTNDIIINSKVLYSATHLILWFIEHHEKCETESNYQKYKQDHSLHVCEQYAHKHQHIDSSQWKLLYEDNKCYPSQKDSDNPKLPLPFEWAKTVIVEYPDKYNSTDE